MKALVRDRYLPQEGSVQIEDIELPHVKDDEVLVRVRAASAKPWDWDMPAIMASIGRITARFHKPKVHVPGLDFAGEVEAVGNDVTRFQPGAANTETPPEHGRPSFRARRVAGWRRRPKPRQCAVAGEL